MIHQRLQTQLEQVARRQRMLRAWLGLALAWILAALAGGACWGLHFRSAGSNQFLATLCLLAGGLASLCLWIAARSARNPSRVARAIEARFPELRACLLAAVEQSPELPDGRFGYLQTAVIRQALDHAAAHPWPQVVSRRRMHAALVAHAISLALFVGVLLGLRFAARPATASASVNEANALAKGGAWQVTVEPGDAEVERGSGLLVLARMWGELPAEAFLVYQTAGNDETRVPMSRSLADPVFGGRIARIDQPLNYRIELAGHATPTFHVGVFEYPRVERVDARLVFPHYTRMEDRLVQDVRTLSVVEGTDLTLICRLNKPVASATLTEDRQAPLSLAPRASEPATYQTTIHCDESHRFRIDLVDNDGRRNVDSAQVTITVLPNQPPTLKPVFPARDVEASPLEELDIAASAWDDIGLHRVGLTYALAGRPPVEVVLAHHVAGKVRHEMARQIQLEELHARPDELLTYHFWAEDFGPDGAVRRTESDMYFAEVRHFEEIFREGDPQGGGQQPGQMRGARAGAAEQLSELQKQIINSTWKVLRRESREPPGAAFADDIGVIGEAQADAQEQLESLRARLQDVESHEHVDQALEAMQQAGRLLQAARDAPSRELLHQALAPEQAAYQALLRLRAREHRVARQQSQAGGAQAGRSAQQRRQLEQLALSNDERRYESQRLANSRDEQPADRENRQVLSRLRELARRQHDLNDRLKELQASLAEARTETQHDEIRRQLKRLQEEQRQILRDAEELQSRMESPQNAEQMSEAREQLDQARDQVRRASDALEREQVSQAAAAGTRAESDFEDLRNEFRRRSSGRFRDDMRQMRDAARELDQEQQELSQRLSGRPDEPTGPRSLSDDGQREQTQEGFARQRQRLAQLEQQMQQTAQEAEQAEPLLAERLYDTARTAQGRQLNRLLEAAERSLERGFVEDARQLEQPAGQGISRLREGVERAAEAVLGDEREALRRARDELNRLADELNREIARNDSAGDPPRNGAATARQPTRSEESPAGADDRPRRPNAAGDATRLEPSVSGRPPQGEEESSEDGSPSERGGAASTRRDAGGRQSGSRTGAAQATESGRLAGPDRAARGGRRLSDARERGGRQTGEFEDNGAGAPLTGQGFLDWSDRLRDVEEMVDDPELRGDAARIRERARAIRAEFKRHSRPPSWDLVKVEVAGPLAELRDRVTQELLRRGSKQALVPLDRDPVPPRYGERTRRYYEGLGSVP